MGGGDRRGRRVQVQGLRHIEFRQWKESGRANNLEMSCSVHADPRVTICK